MMDALSVQREASSFVQVELAATNSINQKDKSKEKKKLPQGRSILGENCHRSPMAAAPWPPNTISLKRRLTAEWYARREGTGKHVSILDHCSVTAPKGQTNEHRKK